MLNSQRTFVQTVKKYCAAHGIGLEVRSQGWLLVMQRGAQRRFAFGYDLGLNSAVTHRIANDKAATSEVLELSAVPCVPHSVFLNPKLSAYVPPQGSWEAMLALLNDNSAGLVVKPNEGTGGEQVFRVRTRPELELAVSDIFLSNRALAVSPYVRITDEVRVVLVDDLPVVVYSKQRPQVTGDGERTLLELVLASIPAQRLSAMLPGIAAGLDQAVLDSVPPAGERVALNWRHNLGSGAEPELLTDGAARDACVAIATAAAQAIGLRFGSVDVVLVDGAWRILEINSGVMMEALGGLHPELVEAAYGAALDRVFGEG
jgi:glutathione synthase/RimK-type ligase-like ATP-grasp enzyme